VALELRDVSARRSSGAVALDGVSLAVREGEIVGIAGVEGNGQKEMALVIAGLARPTAGSVWLGGRDVTRLTVAERQSRGLALVHEDRHARGLVLSFSIADNLALGRTAEWTRRGLLDRAALARSAGDQMKRFDVRATGPGAEVRSLSGGNQQKVVLAREIGRKHVALVAAQPTRGVDVGAIEVIYREILADRAAGTGILLLSAELGELQTLCDRIAVLYRGRIQGILPASEATEERLVRWMTGASSGAAVT
jgi:simple sugar transport system ATP-binding protein